MAYYFSPFKRVDYDISKDNKPVSSVNLLTRFKIADKILKSKAVYYNYNVKEGERADVIAFKYYGDFTLDWLIFLTNNIVDPLYDWPLDTPSLERFIIKKYGSLRAANEGIHHYEHIIQQHEVLYDGTIVPEKSIIIDQTTYDSLGGQDTRIITNYNYEVDKNDKKRLIKLLDEEYVTSVIDKVSEIA